MEAIVNGPNKRGEYEVKWEGFDSSTNTWEKRSGLPKQVLDVYMNMQGNVARTKEVAVTMIDDEPIAKKLKRGAFTQ